MTVLITNGILNFEVPRNGHCVREIVLRDKGGDVIDLTGHSFAVDAKEVAGGGSVLASAIVNIVDATTGTIEIIWDGSDFDAFGSQFETVRVAYDIKDTYPDGLIDIPFRGQLFIIPEVTL